MVLQKRGKKNREGNFFMFQNKVISLKKSYHFRRGHHYAAVVNSSLQTVFCECLCFDIAKFFTNIFSHVIFCLLQARLAVPFRLLHNVYLLPRQLHCNNFAFFSIFFYVLPFCCFPQLIIG